MRKITNLLLVALLAFAGVGCDSNDDKKDDAELFVGTWALTGVSDDEGDQLGAFTEDFNSILLTNVDDGTFTLAVDAKVGDDTTLPGTWSVTESSSKLKLVATTPLGPATLNFTYDFTSSSVVVLTADEATTFLLNNLFAGVDLAGEAVITISRVS